MMEKEQEKLSHDLTLGSFAFFRSLSPSPLAPVLLVPSPQTTMPWLLLLAWLFKSWERRRVEGDGFQSI